MKPESNTTRTPSPDTTYDVIIVGGGPAGLNAALYAARKGLDVALIGDRLGGQMQDTSEVENYIGTGRSVGYTLAERFADDVRRVGVALLEWHTVDAWRREGDLLALTASNGTTYTARAVVLATGSKPRLLGVPGEREFQGAGVSYCATCDGPLYRNKRVLVVGGGNAAAEAALDLARLASHVLVVQRSTFRADAVLMEALRATPTIELRTDTIVEAIEGDDVVRRVHLCHTKTKRRDEAPVDGVFIEIGHVPALGPFAGHVATNAKGEIIIDPHNATSLPNVYAAGDVTDVVYKQIVIAAAEGAKAALALTAGRRHG